MSPRNTCPECGEALATEGCPACDWTADHAELLFRRLHATLHLAGTTFLITEVVQGCVKFMGEVLANATYDMGHATPEESSQRIGTYTQQMQAEAEAWLADLRQDWPGIAALDRR